MTDSQYSEMITMLINATRTRKLSWSWDETIDEYSCTLDKCSIRLSSSVNFQMQSDSVKLMLYNAKGIRFDSISGDSVIDTERYNDLATLYQEVRNSYFQIRESEEMILNKLHELTSKQTSSKSAIPSDDDLPF